MSQNKETVRRIQLTGKSTYIVSLPRRWVEDVRLDKGETLTIIPQEDKTLLLVPKNVKKPEKPTAESIEVTSKDNPNSIIRKVVALYLIGYNTIHITTKEERIPSVQRNMVKEFVRRKLVGTEIVSDSRNGVALQVLLSYPELSVGDALRRMVIIAISMHRDAINALRNLNVDLAEEIIRMDDEVDRFNFYIIRQLKSAVSEVQTLKEIGLERPRDCLGYRLIAKSVERVADHAMYVSNDVLALQSRVPDPVMEELEKMSSFAISSFDQAIKSLFTKDYSSADQVVEDNLKIRGMEKETIKKITETRLDAETVSLLRLIVESIRRTAEYGSDIAEVVLNLTIPVHEW
jgi:phosphate uptake regulator